MLVTEGWTYLYGSGSILNFNLNLTRFDEESIGRMVFFEEYLLVPDDSTGIEIFKCEYSSNKMISYMNVTNS